MLSILLCLAALATDRPVLLWYAERIGDDCEVLAPPLTDGAAFGSALCALGDLDGDGIGDIAVGAPGDPGGGVQRGSVRILLLEPDGRARFARRIAGDSNAIAGRIADLDAFGSALVSPGDLDGDGVPDLAVGAPFDDSGGSTALANRGAVWILFLTPDGEPHGATRITLGAEGLEGVLGDQSWFGSALAAPGDVDGDGIPDLVVGAPGDEARDGVGGSVWLVFMKRNETARGARRIAVGDEDPSAPPQRRGLRFGSALAFLGGPDERGFRRLAVGAPGVYSRGRRAGGVWLLRLDPEGEVRARLPIDPALGFRGKVRAGDGFGSSLASPGDYDGDGPDLFVGCAGTDGPGDATDRGAIWLLRVDVHDRVLSFQPFTTGRDDSSGSLAPFDQFGSALAAPGDLDGNGVPDLVVGAVGAATTGTRRGAAWVLRFTRCSPALAKIRRAPGMERDRLTCADPPRMGKPCVITLDCTDHAPDRYGLLVCRAPEVISLGKAGILLVNALEVQVAMAGKHEGDLVTITIDVPTTQAYCGMQLFAQAAILGDPGLKLTNALDVQIGD